MSFVKRSLMLGSVAMAITAGVVLQGQEVTGTLSGSVKDSKGAKLAGAQVLIRASQLIAPRKVVTDASGTFRAPLLPPGDYQVDVIKDGYAGQGARNVRIGVGASIHQDFTLKPIAQASAMVDVISTSASMDKSDTKAATSISSEEMLALPTSGGDRAFIGAMDLAPGVTSMGDRGVSIRGGKTQETGYTLNGTSIKDDYEGRMNTTRLIEDAVEDTQVIQSPLHARFGRTGGGMVNVVTKSGGNDFAGSLRSYISRDDWQTARHAEPDGSDGRANVYSRRQTDIFFSGPIIKDKLWFAVSTIQKPSEGSRNVILEGEVPSQWTAATPTGQQWHTWDPTFAQGRLYGYDTGKALVSETTQNYIDAKFTAAITPDHTIDFAFQQNHQTITNENPYGSAVPATIQNNSFAYDGVEKYYSYGYRGVLGASTFIEARYSKTVAHTAFPCPAEDHMRLTYGGTASGVLSPYGFNLSPALDKRDNQSGNINLKKFVDFYGNHELDFGFDFYEFLRGTQTQNGSRNLRFYVPAVTDDPTIVGQLAADPYGNHVAFQAVNWNYARQMDAIVAKRVNPDDPDGGLYGPGYIQTGTGPIGQAAVLRKYYGADGTSKTRTTSFYANDSWSINSHFNMMLGLRLDKFRVEDTDKTVLIDKWGPLAPRFQLRYDPDGSTRHLFTFTAAKYVNEFSAGFTDGFIKKANTTYAQYGYTGVPTAAWVNYANITNTDNYTALMNFYDASKNNQLDKFSNPYVIEFTLGYRRAYQNGSYVQVTAISKQWKNDFSISTDIDPSYYVNVPDPTGGGLTPKSALATRWGNSSLLKREYNAVELEFRHNINSTWLFGGNYTYSRLTGNNNGGDNGSQGFYDTTASAPTNLQGWFASHGTPVSSYAPTGLLISNQTQKARLYLTASLPMGKGRISYSALLRYDSGVNYGASGSVATPGTLPTGAGVPTGSMPTAYTAWFSKPGAFTANDSSQVDAKIDWSLPLGYGKLQLMGSMQVDNVFNTQIRTGFVNTFSAGKQSYGASSIAVADPSTFGTDAGNYAYWIAGRNVSASIGLKF